MVWVSSSFVISGCQCEGKLDTSVLTLMGRIKSSLLVRALTPLSAMYLHSALRCIDSGRGRG
jgi:hypothetical protein